MRILWLAAVLSSSPVWAARAYINADTLATKVDSQSDVVASSSNYSNPPLTSRWGAAILDAINGSNVSKTGAVAEVIGRAALASPAGNPTVAAESLRTALSDSQNPFTSLESFASRSLAAAALQSQAALELLLSSLENGGDGRAILTSIAAKGAISKWNALIGEAVKRWQAVAQKRSGANAEELNAIEVFLSSKQTEGIHNVLAAFRMH